MVFKFNIKIHRIVHVYIAISLLYCTRLQVMLQVMVKLEKEKSQGNNKNKKRREFAKIYNYDSEITEIISDSNMPPLPSVQASTHKSYLVRQNGIVDVDGFNAAVQKIGNESIDNFPQYMNDLS